MNKVYLLMFFAVILAAVGDIFLSLGMKQVGAIEVQGVAHALQVGLKVIKNSWILLGTATLCLFFVLYLTALSHGELSLVMPLSAASYILVAVLAKYFLGEEVSFQRMGGIFLVAVGVALVSIS
ncbi:MAG: EamA family transporter [bacterium]